MTAVVEGHDPPASELWSTITREMERLASTRGAGKCLEDFAMHRACSLLERLRLRSTAEQDGLQGDSNVTPALRAELAMQQKRHETLKEMIDEATSQVERVRTTRAALESELAKAQSQHAKSPSRQSPERVNQLRAELASVQAESAQAEAESLAMAAERQQIEQLIAEAERRHDGGYNADDGEDVMKSELARIANRASDNARTLQDAMAEVRKAPPARMCSSGTMAAEPAGSSAVAAFLNSSHGRGLTHSKVDPSNGLFHSSGGLQTLASRPPAGAPAATAAAGASSPSSLALLSPGQSDSLDRIQERLSALKCNFQGMADQRFQGGR
mmetsp:Transcript_27448/g.63940  ORF Transcript_27448/g.63940 Transcript_27448/m.63940 type:complete len:328 (-) Transcript_27448:75-1058(-)